MSPSTDQLQLSLANPMPHPTQAESRASMDAVSQWLTSRFEDLPNQPIGTVGSRAQLEALLREPMPLVARGFETTFQRFQDSISPFHMTPFHPRFLAFIPNGLTLPAVTADCLCAALSAFCGVWFEASGPAQVELVVLDWLKEIIGYPTDASGILTGGGSEANLTALVTAREKLDFTDRSRAVIYVSGQRHLSIDRAASIMGFAKSQIRAIAVDDQFRLDPVQLKNEIAKDREAGLLPWLVVANAGSTNTGAVDPLAEISAIAAAENMWLHVDAAYGWAAMLDKKARGLFKGIEMADSITLDPHKWFAQPFECGCVLIREGRRLEEAFSMLPEYMADVQPGQEEVNFADRGPALTRRFRALKLWFSIQVLGLNWFQEMIRRSMDLAEYAQRRMQEHPAFEILCPRQLSIVCYRLRPIGGRLSDADLDVFNNEILEKSRASGFVFLSSTRLQGRLALRMCFVNWRTTSGDVDQIIDLLAQFSR